MFVILAAIIDTFFREDGKLDERTCKFSANIPTEVISELSPTNFTSRWTDTEGNSCSSLSMSIHELLWDC
jgi:hypothetical protein